MDPARSIKCVVVESKKHLHIPFIGVLISVGTMIIHCFAPPSDEFGRLALGGFSLIY